MNDAIYSDVAVFLNREKGIRFVNDAARCFSDEGNALYDKRFAKEKAFSVIMRCHVPDDIARYIQDNGLLSDASIYASQGEETGLRLVQDNIRFWCGFYRTDAARPELNLKTNEIIEKKSPNH